jgi:hypothetical protein
MKKAEKTAIRKKIRDRTRRFGERIAAKDLVALGTLLTRTKVCGRKTCPCATDPERRHGPYHEWTRFEDGHLLHTILSADQAKLFAEAIKNYRDIQNLLKKWQSETVSILLGLRMRKGQK